MGNVIYGLSEVIIACNLRDLIYKIGEVFYIMVDIKYGLDEVILGLGNVIRLIGMVTYSIGNGSWENLLILVRAGRPYQN